MALSRDKIAATTAHGVHDNKADGDSPERLHDGGLSPRKEASRQAAQDNRKRQVDARKYKRADGVGNKQVHLRFVVAQKTAKHTIFSHEWLLPIQHAALALQNGAETPKSHAQSSAFAYKEEKTNDSA